ncbi:MAG: chemotaxis protein CheA [Planctomycetota bacterium]|nr:MAG: chemotaxis protein CheA [Planctomycetota bacterium]
MEMLDDIVKEFLVESYENLDQLDKDLMALEDSPDDRSRLSSIFRTIHTIKGTSGFLAFPKLEHITHVGENLLVRLRDGALQLNAEITSGLLSMVDAVRSILGQIDSTATEGEEAYEALVAKLGRLKNGESAAPPEAPASASEQAEIEVEQVIRELSNDVAAAVSESTTKSKKSRSNKAKSKTVTAQSAPAAPAEIAPTPPPAAVVSAEQDHDHPAPVMAAATPAVKKEARTVDNGEGGGSAADSSVRIDVHLLDKLMNLVGELVLARNQIMQFSQGIEDAALAAASQRINLITTELQEGVMKTRMQPIRNAWSKLPRVVRDLSISCGKQVQVKMDGAETELDKTILEAIKDPLTHIVRNSVDHGIETAEVRKANGKPAEGTLWLRAYHEGGQVNIEIADDGAGINVDRVRQKAIEKGMITPEQAAAMPDRDAIQLILLPGFSTAAKVTNVSGRGVGMDVVKTNVEKIGGTLDIHSTVGHGTTLRIKIPLTLAIVPALIVTCDEDRYCIPQVSLLELVRLEGDRARKDIELMHSVPVYRLRGQLLPLVFLDEELKLRPRRSDEERRSCDVVNIVVLQAEDRQFGLVVDHINDTQEIVVKPLGQHLKGLATYAGSTIMGDGTVSLILDVLGIAQQSHVLSAHGTRSLIDNSDNRGEQNIMGISWLIVDPQDGTRAAIPLSSVSRLEEIRSESIEKTGRQQVVQYRGEIMPLVSLNDFGQVEPDEHGAISLVVYNDGRRNIGVVVGRIVDIVNEPDQAFSDESCETRIIAGRVTRVVHLEQLAMNA